MRRYAGDNVKLFSIHVSNVLEGVASACRACALVPDAARRADSSCVPCPPGFYIHAETNRCQECPPGTHLAGRHTYGREACVPCGPASVSNRVSDFVLPKNGPARKRRRETESEPCLAGAFPLLQRLLLLAPARQPHADLRPGRAERGDLAHPGAQLHHQRHQVPSPFQHQPVRAPGQLSASLSAPRTARVRKLSNLGVRRAAERRCAGTT